MYFSQNISAAARCIALFCCLLLPTLAGAQNDLTPSTAPDYSQSACWAALPFREDAADETPKGISPTRDEEKQIDVFYVYPTMLNKGKHWNADVYDTNLNHRIETMPIRYQASAFNGSCRVYVPRYRQAHINAYYSKDRRSADAAFELAYSDVAAAFDYYLQHYNQGRPFILASHSQGTTHARRLAKEKIDGKPLAQQLVAAYLVGMPVIDTLYQQLRPCETPDQIGCFVSWMSYKQGYEPRPDAILQGGININPITWRHDTEPSEPKAHLGTILRKFDKKRRPTLSAQVRDGYLWVKSNNFLSKLFRDYHIVDYNLFWYNIRQHVAEQTYLYLDNKY